MAFAFLKLSNSNLIYRNPVDVLPIKYSDFSQTYTYPGTNLQNLTTDRQKSESGCLYGVIDQTASFCSLNRLTLAMVRSPSSRHQVITVAEFH